MPTTTTEKKPWISRGEALAKVESLEKELATLKASKAPAAAIARATETAARTTANELATARREAATKPATVTAAEFGTPELRMSRPEFGKLTAADKLRFVQSGGKLTD